MGLLNALLMLLVGSSGPLLPPDQWDPDRLIQYTPGTSCIVLSAPHGGHLRPPDIVDRRAQGCSYGTGGACYWNATCPESSCHALLYGDPHTREIAWAARDYLAEDGLRPHLVVDHMDRMKMDANRGGDSLSEGVQDDPGARRVYEYYHGFVRQAVEAVRRRCGGRGLLLDIHGQHHPQDWTEIGYLLSKSDLNSGHYPANSTSIRGLIARTGGGGSAQALVNGAGSFGSLLNSFGYPVVPSARIPAPGTGGYYSGGFTTREYGSLLGGEFDALQVEITKAILYAGEAAHRKFARHLATTVGIFARTHGYV